MQFDCAMGAALVSKHIMHMPELKRKTFRVVSENYVNTYVISNMHKNEMCKRFFFFFSLYAQNSTCLIHTAGTMVSVCWLRKKGT